MSTSSQIFNSLKKIRAREDVPLELFYRYDYVDGLWTNNISVQNEFIIENSNHFLLFYQEMQETGFVTNNNKRKPHYIYTRISDNYHKIIKGINNDEYTIIEDLCVCLSNSFSLGNAGHDLAYLLDTINVYINKTNVKFVIFNEIPKHSYNMQLINTYIPCDRIITISENKLYKFKKLLPKIERASYNIESYTPLIKNMTSKLLDIINDKYNTEVLENMKNKTIFIIKTNLMKYVTRPDDIFITDTFYKYINDTDNNICILNPETDNYYEFVYKLLNAKNIFTAQHGISCANQIYFNLDASIYTFIPLENNICTFTIFNNRNVRKDQLCNSYYYNKISKSIYSPLNISLLEIKNMEYLF